MKIYIKSAADISTIQAKIAKKEEDIRKKRQLIDKRNTAIDKQVKVLKNYLDSAELDRLNSYIEYVSSHGTWKLPEEYNISDIFRKYYDQFKQDFGFSDDPLYKIRDYADSIHNANSAIEEYQATLDKYNAQLDKIKQTDKEVDEIPDVLKDFMNQLVDEWDRYDIKLRDESKPYYDSLVKDADRILYEYEGDPDYIPRSGQASSAKLKELYPEVVSYNRYSRFKEDYIYRPFKKKFGVGIQYATGLWSMSDEDIHKQNLDDGKRIILDLVNRVTKITGPITSWSGLYLTQGNGGWSVLNGTVKGEDGVASVDTILAGGWNIQKLHCRTLVKKVG